MWILKTALIGSQIKWQSLYKNEKKILEAKELNENFIKESFDIDSLINLSVNVDDINELKLQFPNILEYEIKYVPRSGDTIWINNRTISNNKLIGGSAIVDRVLTTPKNFSGFNWDKNWIKNNPQEHETWIILKGIKGIFCWNRISKHQIYFMNKTGDQRAKIISNKPSI